MNSEQCFLKRGWWFIVGVDFWCAGAAYRRFISYQGQARDVLIPLHYSPFRPETEFRHLRPPRHFPTPWQRVVFGLMHLSPPFPLLPLYFPFLIASSHLGKRLQVPATHQGLETEGRFGTLRPYKRPSILVLRGSPPHATHLLTTSTPTNSPLHQHLTSLLFHLPFPNKQEREEY